MKKFILIFLIFILSISLMGKWDMEWLDLNHLNLTVTNYGVIGHNVILGSAGGYWPTGYPAENYVYGTGIWFGALMDTFISGPDTLRDTLVTAGYNPSSGVSEFVPGDASDAPVYTNPYEIVYKSTSNWPPRDANGTIIFDSTLSMQDTYCEYSDKDPLHHFDLNNKPLGIQVNQFTYSWVGPLLEDIQFIKITVKNENPDFRDLNQCYFAYTADLDIGNESGTSANDILGFIDTLTISDSLRQLNTGYQFQLESEAGWAHTPGIVSIVYLSSPIATYDIDLYHNGSYIIPMGDEIGMTSFVSFTLATDPSTKQQRYQAIAGYNHLDYDTIDPEASYEPFPSWGNNNAGYPGQNQDVAQAGDKRFIMSCGPFDLPYGDSVSIVFAIAISNNPDDLINHSLLIINFWNNFFNNKVTLLAPPDGAEISSNTNFSWQPFADTDSFRFDIEDFYNDTALMFTGANSGIYNFNTLSFPDGKYKWNVWNYDHWFFEAHSNKRLVIINNPNINGVPHIDAFDANIPIDRCYLTWDIFDPDGDNILKNIVIIREDYNDTLLIINTYDDNYSFSAYNYLPDGDYKAFIRAIDDSLASDSAYDYFSYNGTRPHDPSSLTGGNNNTISVNAIACNKDSIKYNKYAVHFDYPYLDSELYLPYIVYDSTESVLVLSDTAIFDISQSASTYYINGNYYYSPLFDGIGLEITIADSFLMVYDSINIITDIGTAYPESLLSLSDNLPLFGGRDIDLYWHLNGDSIYVDPTLSSYSDIIPYDTVEQYNYLFGSQTTPYEYLNNSTISRSRIYIAGAFLYFNYSGRAYPMDTLWYPEEGEIWRIYSSGDRLPIKGDTYTFTPTGIDNRDIGKALTLNLNNNIVFNNALMMNITGYGICDINLYDITGRMVNKLFTGSINGYKSISLKHSLPTGIYFIKEINDQFNAEKIIIMK